MEDRRVSESDGLCAGDLVKVKGDRATYRVLWIDEYVERPPEVTVIGGKNGAYRTFLAEKVLRARKRG